MRKSYAILLLDSGRSSVHVIDTMPANTTGSVNSVPSIFSYRSLDLA